MRAPFAKTRFRKALLGAAVVGLALTTTTALAGSGVGGVFNLGQTNSVNGVSVLTGNTVGAQLSVLNSSPATTGVGIYGRSASANAGVQGVNTAGGPGLRASVASNSVAPLSVNSTHVVPNLHAANSDALGGGPAATYARSRVTPAGNTMTKLDTAGDVGQSVSVTIGADGLPIISYFDATANSGKGDLKVAHCSNAVCTTATKTTVDTTAGAGYGSTSIILGADGLALIAYENEYVHGLKIAHCSNLACTSATKTSFDPTASVDSISSAIGADGRGLVSYRSYTVGLRVAHCSNAACTSTTLATIDSTGSHPGIASSLAIGQDGLGLISYWNAGLRVAHCNNIACSTAAKNSVDTSNTSVGIGGTSITIGANGLGLISYYDGTSGIKSASCSTLDCSISSTAQLDSSGNSPSNTVGADDLELMTYYGGSALKIAHCIQLECGSAVHRVLDSSADVGSYNALTIGGDGLPVIAYYDYTNKDLKVLHCGSPTCTPYFRRR